MEMITLLIGMLCAFVLGAWVRKPFELNNKTQTQMIVPTEPEIDPLLKEVINAWNYTGKPQMDDLTIRGDYDE